MIESITTRMNTIGGVTVVRFYRVKDGTDWYIHFDVTGIGPLCEVLTAAEGANCLISLYRHDDGVRYWMRVVEENLDILLSFLSM